MIETIDEITRVLELCRVKNLTWNENKKSLRDIIHQRNICFSAQKIAFQYNEILEQRLLQIKETEQVQVEIQQQTQVEEDVEIDRYQDKYFVDIQSEDMDDDDDETNILKFHSLITIDISNEISIVEQYIKYNIMDILPNKILYPNIWENSSYNIDSSLYNIWNTASDEINSQIIYNSIWSD